MCTGGTTSGTTMETTGLTDATTDATTDTDSTTDTDATTDATTTGGAQDPYGPCPDGMDSECLEGEVCRQGMTMQGDWSLCTPGPRMGGQQCDTIPGDACADLPGDGQFQLFCMPQTCSNPKPCPMGMLCVQGFGGNNPAICAWPN